jgi:hypothetical protein
MDLAPVADSQITWRVTDLGPDIKEIRAFLLPTGERVSAETKRLT